MIPRLVRWFPVACLLACLPALWVPPAHTAELAEFRQGLTYYYQKQYNKAKTRFLTAVQQRHEVPRHHYFLASTFVHLDQPDSAVASFRTALRLNPGYTSARRKLASLLYETKQWEPAASHYRKLLNAKSDVFLYRFRSGRIYFEQKKNRRAEEAFRNARDLRSSDPRPAYYLGRLALRADRYEQAEAYFNEAVEKGSDPKFFFYRGLVRFHRRDYLRSDSSTWRSVRDFRASIRKGLKTPKAYFMLGNSLLARGLYLRRELRDGEARDLLKRAIRQYRRVLGRDWNASNAFHNMSVAYLALGHLDLAGRAIREALAQQPEVPFFHDVLGIIEYRRGAYDTALETWQTAMDLGSSYEKHPFTDLMGMKPLPTRMTRAREKR